MEDFCFSWWHYHCAWAAAELQPLRLDLFWFRLRKRTMRWQCQQQPLPHHFREKTARFRVVDFWRRWASYWCLPTSSPEGATVASARFLRGCGAFASSARRRPLVSAACRRLRGLPADPDSQESGCCTCLCKMKRLSSLVPKDTVVGVSLLYSMTDRTFKKSPSTLFFL